MQKLAQTNPDKLIDLLTERLTFERAGVRLYDAILSGVGGAGGAGRLGTLLAEYRHQEKEHEEWLEEQIRSLGGDAHAKTEKAKLVELEAQGIERVILDPATSLPHKLHALLTAELVDNAGWTLLVELAEQAEDETARREFVRRLHHEEEHLDLLRRTVEAQASREVFGQGTGIPVTP